VLDCEGDGEAVEGVGVDGGCGAGCEAVDAEDVRAFEEAAEEGFEAVEAGEGFGDGLAGIEGIGMGDGEVEGRGHGVVGEGLADWGAIVHGAIFRLPDGAVVLW